MSGADFDVSDWDSLSPLNDADLPAAPPPERGFAGVVIGSELATVLFAASDAPPIDLGTAVAEDLAMVRPGLAELARLGSTEPAGLNATQALDAVLVSRSNKPGWRRRSSGYSVSSAPVTDQRGSGASKK